MSPLTNQTFHRVLPIILAAVLVTLSVGPSEAQRSSYDQTRHQRTNQAGDFDYYALVLSWSPTHCASPAGRRDREQCNRRDGRGYSFVLHGLWPQYKRGYPSSCRTRARPFVPKRTITSMMDIMPSKGLIIHEYRKHGTCSGLSPYEYFSLSRKLYDQIQIPAPYRTPIKEQFVSPQQLIAEFTAANAHLKPNMMAVSCRGSGNRLREVRFCFSRDGKLRRCGHNENQRKLCSASRMFVPPVRYSRR
ncbi:MAG: ribonuclease T2 [Alphaproteobacteria bacterium]|nr:ribonuclease T2 [Alphaproteobacteria bacterium]